MKTISRNLIVVFSSLLLVSSATFASSSSGSSSSSSANSSAPKGGLTWFGLGSGSMKVTAPSTGAKFTHSYQADTGYETSTILNFALAVGATGILSAGTIDYDYTNPTDSTHYTQTGADFATSSLTIDAAIVFRLINKPTFHVYVKGGGSIGNETFSYSVDNSSLNTANTSFETSQGTVAFTGTFVEAGIDLLMGGYGLRFSGRQNNMTSAEVDAFNKQKIKTTGTYGILSVIHQL